MSGGRLRRRRILFGTLVLLVLYCGAPRPVSGSLSLHGSGSADGASMTFRSARRASSRRRRVVMLRRSALSGAIVLIAVVVVLFATAGSAGKHVVRAQVSVARPIPAVESGVLPWRLPAPISREVVLPGRGASVVLLGGLNGSTSASGVFTLDTTGGALRSIGELKAGVHDAAGSIVDGRYVVFGGGSPTTVASVEAFSTGHAAQLGSFRLLARTQPRSGLARRPTSWVATPAPTRTRLCSLRPTA